MMAMPGTYLVGAKSFAPACARNQDHILKVLQASLGSVKTVLEVGSGTGQHAVHFARHIPQLTWYTSDLASNHVSINAWIDAEQLPNVRRPIVLDVDQTPWVLSAHGLDVDTVDAVYTANTLHIISWDQVVALFNLVRPLIKPGGLFAVYGPFKVNGQFVSPNDPAFDQSLRDRNPKSGLRDVQDVVALAKSVGLTLIKDEPMPADNKILIFSAAV